MGINLKFGGSKYSADLSNSIYQQKGAGYGLDVNDGMLINNKPDGSTGIARAANMKREMRRAEKISIYADAISLAESRENMFGY
jgi:chaperonin GroEL (HSP60 family)